MLRSARAWMRKALSVQSEGLDRGWRCQNGAAAAVVFSRASIRSQGERGTSLRSVLRSDVPLDTS